MTPRVTPGKGRRRMSPRFRFVVASIRIAPRPVPDAWRPAFDARSSEAPFGALEAPPGRISGWRNRTGLRMARLASMVSAVVLAAGLSCAATAPAESQTRREAVSGQNAVESVFLIGLDYLDSGNPGAAIEIFSFILS